MKTKPSIVCRELQEATGCSFLTAVTAVTTLHPWSMDLWGIAVAMLEQNAKYPDLEVWAEWVRNADWSESKMPSKLIGTKTHDFDCF